MTTTSVHLYGTTTGHLSHARVTWGVRTGLASNGLVCTTGDIEQPGSPANWGFFVGGYPPQLLGYLGGSKDHEVLRKYPRRAALFIAESSVIPTSWASVANLFDVVAFPSRWNMYAFIEAGMNPTKAHLCRHGLRPIFGKKNVRRVPRRPVQMLHVSGAASFLDRKGTWALLAAFRDYLQHLDYRLRILAPPVAELHEALHDVGDSRIELLGQEPWGLPPEKMVDLLDNTDILIQPSRAEAFGMVPLEARARGCRVVMTAEHGHLEHIEHTDYMVATGPPAPISVQGIPNGVAPSVTPEAIAEAVSRAYIDETTRGPLDVTGANYLARWSWEVVTGPLADVLLMQAGVQ